MRKLKVVADSSSDVLSLNNVEFASTPLKVITNEREFIDDKNLDVNDMVDYLETYKGKIKSSCPNVNDWLDAFGDADDIICITITSALSGSYNSACTAKNIFEEKGNKRVFILDTLSAGPELRLILDKIDFYVKNGLEFEEIRSRIQDYRENTGLVFMLKSLKNFANNGRVSPLLAKMIGLFGIHIVGKASDKGTLEPTDKIRGEVNSLKKLVGLITKNGLMKGSVYISHCRNEEGAQKLAELIKSNFKYVQTKIFECRGLCSFYAENGGLLVGYEKF